jgi:hypothetical protein
MFAVALAVGSFLIEDELLSKTLHHEVGFATYLELAWFAASIAMIGGALGSGLESDEEVRVAAYGYRPERVTERSAEGGDVED